MTANISNIDLERSEEIMIVTDFAHRYRLWKVEEARLIKPFGMFPRKHELLINARLEPSLP